MHVESASIGPTSGPTMHDPRVMWAAQKAGLDLSRRNLRPFDETVDIVNYDLVLTMDHFDHEEASPHVSDTTLCLILRLDVTFIHGAALYESSASIRLQV